MKPKLILCLALGLSMLSTSIAQPGGGHTYTSLEAMIMQARVVFRGTITNVSVAVTLTTNQFSHVTEGRNYTFTLTVDEVLKGDLPRKPLEFSVHGGALGWYELETSAKQHARYLWFVNDSEKSLGQGFYAWLNPPNNIYLGPAGPEQTNPSRQNYPIYDMHMTILTNREDILARARAFARKGVATVRLHTVVLNSSESPLYPDYLILPVDPSEADDEGVKP